MKLKSVVKFPPLRENFVDIIWTSIAVGHSNFVKRLSSDVLNYGPYDYSSVMHYSQFAFSILPGLFKTIKGKVRETQETRGSIKYIGFYFQRCDCFGQRNGMSATDTDKLKNMYSCP